MFNAALHHFRNANPLVFPQVSSRAEEHCPRPRTYNHISLRGAALVDFLQVPLRSRQ